MQAIDAAITNHCKPLNAGLKHS